MNEIVREMNMKTDDRNKRLKENKNFEKYYNVKGINIKM
jgi:hypothetical protein